MIQGAAELVVPEPLWETTIGSHGCSVWVGERKPGAPVNARFTWNGKPVWRTLGITVRDDRGRLQKRRQKEAIELAKERFADPLIEGKNPVDTEKEAVRPFNLKEALTTVLSLRHGMYVSKHAHRRDMKRVEPVLLKALKPSFLLSDIRPATARTVWRHVMNEALMQGAEPHGWRKAEKAVQFLYQLTRWLHEQFPERAPDARPLSNWKQKLREEFEDAFDFRLEDPKELRHTHEEAARLFARLDEADPRLAFELMVGAELRSGQVARSLRSQLDLSEVGGFGCGRLVVLGKGKKRGEIVHLDPEMRAFVDRCLGEGGHLHELETAYRKGVIDDYHLFQKGRLRKGVIPLERHLHKPGPIDPGSLIDLFRKFEQTCGVEHVPNRSFYGLRRVLTDIAPYYTSDTRELDRLTGHEDPATRERIYQNRLREEHREGAAEARREMRQDLVAGRPPPKRRRRKAEAETAAEEVRDTLQRVLGVDVDLEQARALQRMLRKDNDL